MPANTLPPQTVEVVCPLKNSDGTHCRKRCVGDKRYRSMIEHVRRVHSEHYIPKLPATEESFALMVNTPLSDRPQHMQQQNLQSSPQNTLAGPVGSSPLGGLAHLLQPLTAQASNNDFNQVYKPEFNYSAPPPRSSDEYRRGSLLPATNAAEVLAQLHQQSPAISWEPDNSYGSDMFPESDIMGPRLAPIDPPMDPRLYGDDRFQDQVRSRDFLPTITNRSPPYHRSSTLPPAGRLIGSKPSRPRKSSITQNSRKPKHERTKSKDHQRRMSYDRKAMSAEPSSLNPVYGKRWEDLIDAAASATEEDSRDFTPVPPSPRFQNRNSLPPLLSAPQFQNHTYTASPLQRALTPPAPDPAELQPFPSVESSVDSSKSGHRFHIAPHGLSDASPQYSLGIQIYCASCHQLSKLQESYACTECICGLCKDCVDAFCVERSRHKAIACPRCNTIGGKFKPFQLDLR